MFLNESIEWWELISYSKQNTKNKKTLEIRSALLFIVLLYLNTKIVFEWQKLFGQCRGEQLEGRPATPWREKPEPFVGVWVRAD